MSDSYYNAALIGGPEAGKVYGVRNRDPLRIMLPPDDLFVFGTDVLKPIETKTVIYEPRCLSFFGAPLYVWCAPEFMGDDNRTALGAQVGAHILNPLGLALLREGQQ